MVDVDVDELMQWAAACSASGDSDGELQAYRQADELGDAEAAILLGNALRSRGDVGPAKEAYERSEARGHREAAMSLGNLLSDMGDKQSAKAAYLRSIELGSTIALFNLGLMLAGDGESDEAMVYLQRAADNGDPGGFWGIGRILEQQRSWVAAADVYQRGAELGDSGCAFGQGVCLYEQGDLVGARAAFQHANDLGHDRASELLEALDREEGSAPSADIGPTVDQLWSKVTDLFGALASHRQELGRQWIAATVTVQEQRAKLDALKGADADIRQRFTELRGQFSSELSGKKQRFNTPVPASSSSEWLRPRSGRAGQWDLADAQARSFDADLEEARTSFFQAGGKTFGGSLRQKGTDALSRVEQRLDGLASAIRSATRVVAEAEQSRESAAAGERGNGRVRRSIRSHRWRPVRSVSFRRSCSRGRAELGIHGVSTLPRISGCDSHTAAY